ncbi:CGNR zinc finger domain-containing protein [Actinocrispum wychmicini]|uniref:CGNR zinc finger protein n=1 Tax=Actinocrispum wychmicini TaxID=1213861 RepID=A0A4R2JUJ8_9PSEU|nr:CGNR zinc finger domain-containing protein [Actinocrispum wychmicini]TCO60936.1 CGNR zinc finger protein [Actinocrispum wychmicini]
MHFNPYGGPAAELAATIVNSRHVHPEDAKDLVTAMFESHNRAWTTVTAAEAVEILAWGERLSPAFGERDLDRLVDVVNGLLRDTASRPFISRHDGRAPHIHYAPEDADQVTRTRAFTAAGIAHVLAMDPARLGRCANDGCDTAYVDTSRNGRRRFCSTRCATRVHVADHRSRARV